MVDYPELPTGAVRNEAGGIKFGPLGYCLYCGEIDGLTDEHIVPYGLNGNIVLPKSSCFSCQKITSKIELFVLRDMLGMLRTRHNLKSRHRKKRADREVYIDIVDQPYEERVQLNRDELPTVICMPNWGSDSLCWTLGLVAPEKKSEMVWRFPSGDAERILEVAGNRPYQLPNMVFNQSIFARFIAKIGLSFAYAAFGGLPVATDLSNLILCEDVDFRTRVGSEMPRTGSSFLWKVSLALGDLHRGGRWLAAQIEFFTPFHTPTYFLMIGEDKEKAIDLPPLATFAMGLNLTYK